MTSPSWGPWRVKLHAAEYEIHVRASREAGIRQARLWIDGAPRVLSTGKNPDSFSLMFHLLLGVLVRPGVLEALKAAHPVPDDTGAGIADPVQA